MALIEVTVSELQNASAKIVQANDTFIEAAGALKAAAEALAGTWEGSSRDAFVAEQEQIDTWYKLMADCVARYADSMKSAAAKYESTDQAAASVIRRG